MDLDELQQLGQTARAEQKPLRIRCCTAAGCLYAGSPTLKDTFVQEIAARGLSERAEVVGVGCLRLCSAGPLVQLDPTEALYGAVKPADVPSILSALDGGRATARPIDRNMPFFTRQMPIVLANSGLIDPERIEAYL